MATFKLRKFREPDALRAIDPARLKMFLGRFDAYFRARGFELLGDADLDYEQLVAILMTPDESVPIEMVNALYHVHELSNEGAMEKLLELISARDLPVEFKTDPTPADVAIAVWLTKPVLVEEVHAESFVMRAKRFTYFWGAAEARPIILPDPECHQLKAIEERLDAWFVARKKGAGSKVFAFRHAERLHFLVKHGATMRREGSLKDGPSTTEYFRPEVHSVLVYDAAMDLLALNSEAKGERDHYREVFGAVLFGDEEYFGEPFKISLDPLREIGPEALNCEDVPEIASVKLVEIRRYLGGTFKERHVVAATDLFRTFSQDWRKRLGLGNLVGASFELVIGQGRARRKRRVTLSSEHAKFDRDDDDAELIESWLRRRRFMSESQEDGVAAGTNSVVESPGANPRQDDRAAGMATAAE